MWSSDKRMGRRKCPIVVIALTVIVTFALGGFDTLAAEGEKEYTLVSVGKRAGNDRVLTMDLNFDGWEDLCIREGYGDGVHIPYRCMLWNQQRNRYEFSAVLYNVEIDPEKEWIVCRQKDGEKLYSTRYYRYDQEGLLHMVRYVEENEAEDAVFEKLDLTYVEGGIYTLPAVVNQGNRNYTMLSMAKQALLELYQWTGEKVDTACFRVSDMGGVVFAMSPEDIEHSRIFFSRYFGTDTVYNLSGYDKCISSIDIMTARSVWYSPVSWHIFPKDKETMTDEEVMIWYFERFPGAYHDRVKTIEQRYADMWTIQTELGKWFEVVYDAKLREIVDVTGPYAENPVH